MNIEQVEKQFYIMNKYDFIQSKFVLNFLLLL